jgi:hypothetical protein
LIDGKARSNGDRSAGPKSSKVRSYFSMRKPVYILALSAMSQISVQAKVVPLDFALSFDNFRTVRMCRLIWRQGDFLGVAFES